MQQFATLMNKLPCEVNSEIFVLWNDFAIERILNRKQSCETTTKEEQWREKKKTSFNRMIRDE